MRYYEIKGGIQVPLSNEERRLVESVEEAGQVKADDLDERDRELSRQLCGRGIFNMIENEEDDSITYTVNKLEEIWRD
ncbi:hypothetical protein D3C87_482710 [compost metagenome]